MAFGQNFPVSEYYRDMIIDARTISRFGGWWTAVLLINDPDTKKPFLAFYRWQREKDSWKTIKTISFRNKKHIKNIMEILPEFIEQME